MITPSNSKIIAKNTILLYIRMMVTMVITLYTSRVILQKLGVDDYGLYQAVCGIVSFFVFINSALSTGTSRFLTFSLGEQNFCKLKKTFATTFTCHILISIFIVFIAETLGLWMIYNQLEIPDNRFNSALFAYHFSIATTVLSLLMVPFSAVIIAREKMTFFAYLSIVEVILKLFVVYALSLGGDDKLRLYAVLLFIVQIFVFLAYYIYCRVSFEEVRTTVFIDKPIFKEIIGFSAWSLFAGCSTTFNSQGIIVLLNIFFSSPVVVARSISLQVNSAITQFTNNFRTAVNPQIVKQLASGNRCGSQQLLLASTKYSYFLMYGICLPLFLLAPEILFLWLDDVPEYTILFTRLILVQSLFQVFDTSFYTALYAEGRLRENALISPVLGLMMFPLVYTLFKLGYSPVCLSWVFMIFYAFLGMVVKPILIVKIAQYKWDDILHIFKTCALVTLVSFPIPFFIRSIITVDNLLKGLVIIITSLIITSCTVWFLGLNRKTRRMIINTTKKRIKNENSDINTTIMV